MNRQEQKIVSLLLNEMAFEGAKEHFRIAPPEIPIDMFDAIRGIGIPLQYDGSTESYRYAVINFDEEKSVFENCYRCLRVIRNNIIHANKAYRPDTPERLSDLLDWSDKFIQSVYASDSEFAKKAQQIKDTLGIESF